MLFTSTPTVAPTAAAPACIKERLSYFNDPRFTFDPEPHEYKLGERVMTSCTTWFKEFKKPFIREEVAASMEARYGLPAQQYLDEWDRAGWIGTRTHEFIEYFYNGRQAELTCTDDEVGVRCLKFLQLHQERLQDFDAVGQEVRMFHEDTGLCGTLDFLGLHRPTGKLYVGDWKTSKAINTDEDQIYRYLLRDFSDLPDNEHNLYSLQISLYRIMLEEVGIRTAGGFIGWLPTGDTPPKIFTARDFRLRLRQKLNLMF